MDAKDTLELAIQKAIAGGWKDGIRWIVAFNEMEEQPDFSSHVYAGAIYSHDFAKSLWGHTPIRPRNHTVNDFFPNYKFHLQQMVIADNPIAYLKENMPEAT